MDTHEVIVLPFPHLVPPFTTLAEFLTHCATLYGNLTVLAAAIDVSPSHLSRVASGTGSMDVITCLRLAEVTGTNPTLVLKLAGKADVAILIESLYQRRSRKQVTMPALPPDQREVIALWTSLTQPEDRAAALEALRHVADLAAEVAALVAEVRLLSARAPATADTPPPAQTAPAPPRRRRSTRAVDEAGERVDELVGANRKSR